MTEHRSAAEIVAGLDLRGKVCLVAGVSSGLGAETARVLAGAGAMVVGTARDVSKACAAVGDPGVEIGELELDSLASVRRFARWFDASHSALHALVNKSLPDRPGSRNRHERRRQRIGVSEVQDLDSRCIRAAVRLLARSA